MVVVLGQNCICDEAEAVCQSQAKGDNSCTEEEATVGAGGQYKVAPLSYGDIRWEDFDWKAYQAKDLSEEDLEEPVRRFSLNIVESSKLAPDRSLPDNRAQQCEEVNYDSHLAESSVIITFRTEPRSTLLRTVVSVLNRTPPHILREIILVDDNNDDESVGKELASIGKVDIIVISTKPIYELLCVQVKLIRNRRREGLIRSRNIASKVDPASQPPLLY